MSNLSVTVSDIILSDARKVYLMGLVFINVEPVKSCKYLSEITAGQHKGVSFKMSPKKVIYADLSFNGESITKWVEYTDGTVIVDYRYKEEYERGN